MWCSGMDNHIPDWDLHAILHSEEVHGNTYILAVRPDNCFRRVRLYHLQIRYMYRRLTWQPTGNVRSCILLPDCTGCYVQGRASGCFHLQTPIYVRPVRPGGISLSKKLHW